MLGTKGSEDVTPSSTLQHSQSDQQQSEIESYDTNSSYDAIDLGTGLHIPREIWTNLLDYQKTCWYRREQAHVSLLTPKLGVKWLWELHSQKVGGIIGDEMVDSSFCFLC